MYVNTRDKINFHSFLRILREMNGASLLQVAGGICTESEISRFENGDRLPEKLIRDRVTARLGVSGEEYEEYLRPKEYAQWQIRMELLRHINEENLEEAEKCLAQLKAIPKLNAIQLQFNETMDYMIDKIKGASKDLLRAKLQLAIACTMPSVECALNGAHLLADQELNLIVEQISIEGNRIEEYKTVLDYIERSHLDTVAKAKLYPRISCFIARIALDEKADRETLSYALDLCNESIEYLRDTCRLHCFLELLELRDALMDKLGTGKDIVEKDKQWIRVLKDVYTEWGFPIYTNNFTYLYTETQCNNAVKVLRDRRTMVGISRTRICEDVCDERTIIRIETGETGSSMVLLMDMYDKIGLCAEYKRSRVFTDKPEAFQLHAKLSSLVNDFENEDAQAVLEELKAKVYSDLKFNEQEILRFENILQSRTGNRSEAENYENAIKALEQTVLIKDTYKRRFFREYYFSDTELQCLSWIAFMTNGLQKEHCIGVIKELCEGICDRNLNASEMTMYEMLTNKLVSYLGNEGEFDLSSNISKKIIKESIAHRRGAFLAENYYNILWNAMQSHRRRGVELDVASINRELEKCLYLSDIVKRSNWVTFFSEKMNK